MTTSCSAVRGDEAAVTGPDFRQFMRSWPCGVAVVTARSGPEPPEWNPASWEPAGCTVNAMLSVSLDPPLILISLSARSRTLAAITAQGAFGINVLAAREQQLAERFARSGGDRFAGVRYRFERGVPLLDSAIATAVCRLEQTVAAADHILLLGRPQWCVQDGGPDPLIFLGGAYQTLVPGPASC